VAQAETQLKSTQAQAIDIGVPACPARTCHCDPDRQATRGVCDCADTAESRDADDTAQLALGTARTAGLILPPAERRVAAANAQVGVAKSAFFPALTLSASAGFQSSSFAQWLTVPSRFWAVGPAIAQSIFDADCGARLRIRQSPSTTPNVAAYRQTGARRIPGS